MDFLIAILFVLGLIVASVVLSFWIDGIVSLCIKIVESKRKKAHPQLWLWFKECNDLSRKDCLWYNEQIAPAKKKIDAILSEWNYYSTETKNQKEEELENLRIAIECANKVYDKMCAKTETIRTAIHNYVEEHNLEWARRIGW